MYAVDFHRVISLTLLINAEHGDFHGPHFTGKQAETEANLSCICEAKFSISWCIGGIPSLEIFYSLLAEVGICHQGSKEVFLPL